MDPVSVRRRRKKINTVHLPGEIITDILLRLPFDSILNCKLVSTEWRNQVNSPTFYMNYKGYSNSMSLFTDYSRLFCLRIRHDKNKQLTKDGNPRFTIHQVPIAIDHIYYTHFSNGIVCVLQGRVFYFYNLFTGLPALHTVTNSPPRHHHNFAWKHYGFGYDSYGDDHKIVLACHYEPQNPDGVSYAAYADNTQYLVYSFKDRDWKSFTDFPYYANAPDNYGKYAAGTTVNGVVNWLVPENGVMVTYDLHTGVFGEIRLPGVSVNEVGNGLEFCIDFTLQEVGGKLCYTYKSMYTDAAHMLDVWRMVGDDWEMLASINCDLVGGFTFWNSRNNPERPLLLHEYADGRMLILFMDRHRMSASLSWLDFVNYNCETIPESVWHPQRIKNKCRAIVKRKTSRMVKK